MFNNFPSSNEYYIINGKCRWLIVDENGNNVNYTKIKLDTLLDNTNEVLLYYQIILESNKLTNFKQVLATYDQNQEKIRFRALYNEADLNVTLPCDSLEKAEELTNLVCSGENLRISIISSSAYKSGKRHKIPLT